ncbi:bifunctional tRNA (5-methylaminomethyl-2-thiouridine)(34)-methyltransferase MnmD/FAD-dependent 5-carboxymethylaminomethyl-2-thiouridine(34) oxidoreductase MnmC [Pokkaliibacter sp. MBI-7]|uniref:bifunctional tRNA (5-methylaminomethyl-2-thiouridine)(34)-methyltransferase MnmD/FAD-dependent 5-carboxymethylaminomethyl-2-thiouridine(34) oxidoreductase MnmC n=1 Tax=Pokkaliibacter sp. MBI-7 TaxID=3040600 RepID=UPI002446D54A|nr:bifunctional tRNA (5-methylaminomethyl-2-thiouridine)(34)-methyltransferase MnmD/FAD-dependent 5-carboxymethylaminomethyl-2-thiouridine(34) oxidoreductase MnmC [Pokkaliibacter sp. MBI-7]MDH2431611.1 bifunctional tRNA (5-methylaminomethyl-2-thiouridine)(34)-methyltransferase MnmD/FAD-dependent 5-carboxymethylaminomethyl-2-thiouridine(34) oxidoreductase MnmC [Pokkaliibacter sp. MBI-7]
MPSSNLLGSATLTWDEQGLPESSVFGDVYFSRESGLLETDYVFIQHNDLPRRWQHLTDHGSSCFVIAETGFGTGLNFLVTWKNWLRFAPSNARLHFVSVEKFPLNKQDLQRALALWPDLQELASELLAQYPCALPGFHRMYFAGGKIALTLLFGDVHDCLPQLDAKVDAWFLDGFAPAKNPEMWQPQLYQQMARLSKPGTTFSTFTSAGIVKRGIAGAGFEVSKVAGFGRKREMLCGKITEAPCGEAQPSSQKTIAIIGAGLAGCSLARAMAERDYHVIVLERHPEAAQEASGNPQGILYLKLPKSPSALSQWHSTGLLYTRNLLQRLLPDNKGDDWDDNGVIQIALKESDAERQRTVAGSGVYPADFVTDCTTDSIRNLSGYPINEGGLLFSQAGWVSPPVLCKALLNHPNITLQCNSQVKDFTYVQGKWQLRLSPDSMLEADILALACAYQTKQFGLPLPLPINEVKGQISTTKQPTHIPALQVSVCKEGYVAPPRKGMYCFGATFERNCKDLQVTQQGHHQNLSKLEQILPELASAMDASQFSGRVAFRCTTQDHLPIAGPYPCKDSGTMNAGPTLPGTEASSLFFNIGHGSKGLITAPLAAELIACQISGEPLPLNATLIQAVTPGRWSRD